jgi:Flp pilus assembly protein TadD
MTRLALARARTLITEGHPESAAKLLAETEVSPGAESARVLFQAIAAYHTGDLGTADRCLTQARESGADFRFADNWSAIVQARRGDIGGAVRLLRECGLIPYTDILIELAVIFESHLLRHPDQRVRGGLDPDLLRAVAGDDLSSAPPAKRLSARGFETAYQRRDLPMLLAHAVHCLRQRTLRGDGRMILIHCLLESGLVTEALDASRALAEQCPQEPPVLSQLGLVAVRAGELREALLALSRVAIEGPEDFNCHWHLGLAALAAGDEGEARWFFAKALRDYFIGSFEDSWTRLWNTVTAEQA